MSTEKQARAWIEIRGAAFRRNLRAVRSAVGPEPALIPMVKANAYGLGVGPAVSALEIEGPWGYGVATVAEGVELRGLGVTRPVLVFSPVPMGALETGVREGLTFCISDLEALEGVVAAADRLGRDAAIHVEVDTGMGRSGMDWRRAGEWGPAVVRSTRGPVRLEGVFTHFHSADEGEGEGVELQAERLRDAMEAVRLPEGENVMVHLCNSAAALRRPDLARGGVRPGIFLYGGRAGTGLPEPEPVVHLRARIALIREVPPGTTVGYGATYRAGGWERWATVGLGYGDGFPRCLGNRAHALVRGRRVPIIGRISMDMTVVDITDLPEAKRGDVATFVGTDGDEAVSLEEVARHAGTINYEILTGLTSRLPRIWVEEGDGHSKATEEDE
jgi:alanine racemase